VAAVAVAAAGNLDYAVLGSSHHIYNRILALSVRCVGYFLWKALERWSVEAQSAERKAEIAFGKHQCVFCGQSWLWENAGPDKVSG
jgi:hypothetical protein